MAYFIEVIANKEYLNDSIEKASKDLNKVQDMFLFKLPPQRLRSELYEYEREEYDSVDALEELKKYRTRAKGNRPFLIFVIDGPLYSSHSRLKNLFGSAINKEGLAVFTIDSHSQFVQDIIRFCRFYLVRYSLSFFCPDLRSHNDKDRTDCVMDKKMYKPNIKIALDSGNLCTECKGILQNCKDFNIDIKDAFEKLLGIVSNQISYSLVMKGGGVKGLAFAGAILELEKYFGFDTFVGTSAGSIAAVLLGAGYRPKELLDILYNKDFRDFRDANWGAIPYNLLFRKGLYPGDHIEQWISRLIKKKYTSLLREPQLLDLMHTVVYASRWSDGTLPFDSNRERKESLAAFAARCSMSIPYYFIPRKVDNIKVYDGGLRNNFPLREFIETYPQKPFLGLYLKSNSKKSGFVLIDLLNITIEGEERRLVDENRDKVIVIDTTPVKTTEFNLCDTKKQLLITSGRVSALIFLRDNYPDFELDSDKLNDLEKQYSDLRKELIS